MKYLDHVLQKWRIHQVQSYIPMAARVLDVGCGDGELFRRLGGRISGGIGIDPGLEANTYVNGVTLVAGSFPQEMPAVEPFDVITMLAVLEHFPPADYLCLRHGCSQYLKPHGLLIITVPSATVDKILWTLKLFRLIDGLSLEQHHGYDVAKTTEVFSDTDFLLKKHSRFQLGLNNLFLFERI